MTMPNTGMMRRPTMYGSGYSPGQGGGYGPGAGGGGSNPWAQGMMQRRGQQGGQGPMATPAGMSQNNGYAQGFQRYRGQQPVLNAQPAAPAQPTGDTSMYGSAGAGVQRYQGAPAYAMAPSARPTPAADPAPVQPGSPQATGTGAYPVQGTTLAGPRGIDAGKLQKSNSAAAAAQGYAGTQYQTGMFDPTNPNQQYTPDGRGALNANNGENSANMWAGLYGQYGQAAGNQQQQQGYANADRTAMQTAMGGAPAPYQFNTPAPAAYQAGAAPSPYSSTMGPRPAFQSAGDIATATTQLGGTPGGQQVNPGQVVAPGVQGYGAAFNQAAQGIMGTFSQSLADQSKQLAGTAAGRGRLDSGFYNQDQGTLTRQLGSQANDQLLSAALSGAQLDQSAAIAGAQLGYNASAANASNQIAAGTANNQNNQYLTGIAANRADTTDTLGQSGYTADQQYGLAQNNQNYGQYADQRNFGAGQQQTAYSQYADQRNFGQSNQAQAYGQYADQRNAAIGNYQFDTNQYDQATGMAMQQLSGLADRTDANNQAIDAKNASSGIGGFLKSALPGIGAIAGFALGGPAGAAIGGGIGNGLTGKGYNGGSGGQAPAAPQGQQSPYAGYGSVLQQSPYQLSGQPYGQGSILSGGYDPTQYGYGSYFG